ncbi:MAG: hypothetical protein K6A97_09155 [Lachnospiraceae bacterium]|nr:hypothetical protein [Lachnospiraceae bacterium]
MELANCYGIPKMNYTIDYSKKNVAIIYAPNGTMKSSLAKTFKDLREQKEPRELIFGRKSSCTVVDERGNQLNSEEIMVVNPFEEEDFANQGLLMANSKLRKEYIRIHKTIDEKKDILYEKFKGSLGYTKRSEFDAQKTMLLDWGYTFSEEKKCVEKIISHIGDSRMDCSLAIEEIKYAELFNDKAITMLKTGDIAKSLEDYEKKYSEMIDKSPYMQKGVIDHNNYGAICNALGDNGFFKANNNVTLVAKDGSSSITVRTKEELDNLIQKEKDRVLNDSVIKGIFEQINKSLQKNKDTQTFAKLLRDNPNLVIEYRDVDLFKKKIWVKVFGSLLEDVKDLLAEINKAEADLAKLNSEAKKEETDWHKALELFKQRFYVPFNIETSNKEDVILKAEMPSFKYIFKDENDSSEVTKDDLLVVLSTGEKRAYFILNMIFQVLVAKKSDKEYLLVLDDISESFDYRNKYAIIEYIKDISEMVTSAGNKAFTILLLTHNFDFYRTVASRITGRDNAHIAYWNGNEISFEQRQYISNVFGYYKGQLNKDNIVIASIPFVRNLIEYTEGDNNQDYLLLTSLLHSKDDTNSITIKQVQDIFNKYWCKNPVAIFANGRENEKVIDIIIREANKIADIESIEIENKLILSMALRHKTETYMKYRLINDVPNGSEIVAEICTQTCQSGKLIDAYKRYIDDDKKELMEIVSMITPENIHINSFMFEPILDMSLRHLYNAYHQACELST